MTAVRHHDEPEPILPSSSNPVPRGTPLPDSLAALLVEVAERLTATTADAPLAALRAVGVLERIAARVGREAAGVLAEDGVSAERWPPGSGPPAPRP
ncbi:hypothetical protein OG592_40865 (plasmid) [Streptomyces avidinii]|uniref:hypothetical protein n=1 Tax=Streptomyces avidinii TaxID=1895 RepID=UPI002F9157E1|nr:hypothetical protein OG592_40865 [Streptomyces avidinii]